MLLMHLPAFIFLCTKLAACHDETSSVIFRIHSKAELISSGVTSSLAIIGSPNKCAMSCLSKQAACDGFTYNSSSAVCNLQKGILCFLINETKEDLTSGFVSLSNVTACTYSTELALNKPAQIPSMYGYHPSEWGNDGLFGQFFETQNSSDPWWRCDLENTHAVSAFKLYNRLDCCSERAQNLLATVALLEADIMDNTDNRCGYIDGQIAPVNLVTCPHPLIGRFVQVQVIATTQFHLLEVEVHGYY